MNEKSLIFTDETGFNARTRQLYGYRKKGVRLVTHAQAKGSNHSVIAAINCTTLLGYKIYKGSIAATEFGAFMVELLLNNNNNLEHRQDWVFVLGNASIHKSKKVMPFLNNFNVLFWPPYFPFLNPIEEVFSRWKQSFRKIRIGDQTKVYTSIINALRPIKSSNISNFYRHALQFLFSLSR